MGSVEENLRKGRTGDKTKDFGDGTEAPWWANEMRSVAEAHRDVEQYCRERECKFFKAADVWGDDLDRMAGKLRSLNEMGVVEKWGGNSKRRTWIYLEY